MARARYISPAESLGRPAWHWCIFDGSGAFVCRGKSRLEALRRAERAERLAGKSHGPLLIAKNDRTQEKWVRLRGSWYPSPDPRHAVPVKAEGAA